MFAFDKQGNKIQKGNIVLVAMGANRKHFGIVESVYSQESEPYIIVSVNGEEHILPIEINGACNYVERYSIDDIHTVPVRRYQEGKHYNLIVGFADEYRIINNAMFRGTGNYNDEIVFWVNGNSDGLTVLYHVDVLVSKEV